MAEPLIKVGHIIMPIANIAYLYKIATNTNKIYIRNMNNSGVEGIFENEKERNEWYDKFTDKFVTKI